VARHWYFRLALIVLLLLASKPVSAAEAASSEAPITVESLKAYEHQVEQLVARALPCTVCVRSRNGAGSGSGVVVSDKGLVLTAAHVVQAAGRDLVVVFPDGREVGARPLGANRNRDAAMIQLEGEGTYAYVELGASDALATNQWCVALGHAGGFDPRRTPPVRLGRVLVNATFVMTDSALISGDSGGPLFDLDGRLIGIHSNIGVSLSQNNHVPIDAFTQDWDRLLQGDTWGRLPGAAPDPNRPVVGFQLGPRESETGATITSVLPGSPAEKAGIRPGDVLLQVDGRDVPGPAAVVEQLQQKKVGDAVALKLQRGDEILEISANLVRALDLNAQPPKPDAPPKTDRESDQPKPDAAAEPPQDSKAQSPAKSDDGKLDLEELMRRARQDKGRVKLTREQFEQLQKLLAERGSMFGTDAPVTEAIVEWGRRVFASYAPVVAPVRPSILPVLVENRQVALATAVSNDGRLITKASEIDGKSFQVDLGNGKFVDGKLVTKFDDYDLAVVRVEGAELVAVNLEPALAPPRLGMFVAAASHQAQPEAIGVVSVLARNMDASQQGYLGVMLDSADDGVRLIEVQPQTPAAAAGLENDDVILSVNGQKHSTPAAFAKAISEFSPGDTVSLKLRRGDHEFDKQVALADRAALPTMPGGLGMLNQMGGSLSKRRAGFKLALQHDCPIDPEDCGAPLVDLDGRILGINIARSGRVDSLAIPADVVRELLKSVPPAGAGS